MFTALRRLSARIGVWPRRIACVACLVLAAASALSGGHPAARASSPPAGPATRLRPGEVAVPVGLPDGAATGYLHPGDRVSLVAHRFDPVTGQPAGRATLVAAGVRVLAITRTTGMSTADGAALLVAARRDQALRVAAADTSEITAIVDP